jgi:hypothetical protein
VCRWGDGRRGVAGVVDQVGEQRDAAGGDEHQCLCRGGETEHEQRKGDRAQSLSGALNRVVNEGVAVAVMVRGVGMTVSGHARERARGAGRSTGAGG